MTAPFDGAERVRAHAEPTGESSRDCARCICLHRSRRRGRHPRRKGRSPIGKELLTIAQVCEEMQVARSTLDLWRRLGTAPQFSRLPNNSLRVSRDELERWLSAQEAC